MLQAIRSKVGSWFVKILFAFLILSFAVWGINDVFSPPGPDSTVITAGDTEVTLRDVDRRFRSEIESLRQMIGEALDTGQAIQFGLLDGVIDQIVTEGLLLSFARETGLSPSDALISAEVLRQPIFIDPVTGRFDRNRFLQVLAANGLTEVGYVELLRRDIARGQLVEAIGAAVVPPEPAVDALFAHHAERRDVEGASVDSLFVTVDAPTDSELRAFHETNPDRFTAPERRSLTVASLTLDQAAEEVPVSEDILRDEYERRRASFETPEQRAFDQVILQSEDRAQVLADAARAAGGDLAAAARSEGVSIIRLDRTTQAGMFGDLGTAGFALDAGAISDPVETSFGWHVLRPTEIVPGATRPFEEVRDELRRAYARDLAFDVIFEIANLFEDEMAGGAAIEEAAAAAGLSVIRTPPIARNGSVAPGAAAPRLPDQAEILESAFALEPGEDSLLVETRGGNLFMVRVDGVEPPAVEPFDQVRDRVRTLWEAGRRQEAALARADTIAEQMRAGQPLADAALSQGATTFAEQGIVRSGANAEQVPMSLIDRVFAGVQGDILTGQTSGGAVVLRIDRVHRADPTQSPEILSSVRDQLQAGLRQDLIDQLLAALRQRYPVDVNREAIENFYNPV